MRKCLHKNQTENIRVKRWYAVALKKGDIFYAFAFDEIEAIASIFGDTDSNTILKSVDTVTPCNPQNGCNFTLLGK